MPSKIGLSLFVVTGVSMLVSVPSAFGQPEAPPFLARGLQASTTQALEKGPAMTECKLLTPDFVITGSSSSTSINEHCFPSDQTGNFGPRYDISDLVVVDGVDVADMDNDGDNDFLACDGITGNVYLYSQGSPNMFTRSVVAGGVTPVGAVHYCTNLRIADFNNDGLRDFVVGNSRLPGATAIYTQGPPNIYNQVSPTLDLSWAVSPNAVVNGIATGDTDGDGNDDVMVLGFIGAGAGEVWWYQGNGDGTVQPPVQKVDVSADFPVVSNPTGLGLFDLDGDGDLDLVVGGSFDGSHYVYSNNGVNNFSPPPAGAAFTTNEYSGIDSYDVDLDQDEDLVLVNWNSQQLLLVENQGGVLLAPTVVGTLNAPSLGVGAPERPKRVDFDLDHFKCYPAETGKVVDDKVELADQFNEGTALVSRPGRFCNAVTKWHDGTVTPIQNPDAHLEMLAIEAEGETPALVEVTNQFGRAQQLEIAGAAFLAVPTQKIIPGNHPAPKDLDHFKCYEASGKELEVEIDLRDQFVHERELVVTKPQLLCNPTEKQHNGRITPIENPLDHLVCYSLLGTQNTAEYTVISNQFGDRDLALEPADLLCVPSRKRLIK